MGKFLTDNISLLLALALLGAMGVANLWHPAPADAEPYHKRVREAVQSISYRIGDWIGIDRPLPQAAVELLQPNALFSRDYRHVRSDCTARFLWIHCKDARDLVGHYPPICYVAHGWVQEFARPRRWRVEGMVIEGTEYGFSFTRPDATERIVVASFMVLPGGQILRDMQGVREAAADYTAHFYGAAQIQLVTDASLPDRQRDAALRVLVGANLRVIEAMRMTNDE